MNEEQRKLLEEGATTKNNFYKFEKDKRLVVGLTQWSLKRKEVESKFTKELESKIQFSCQVLHNTEDGVEMTPFDTISVRFMEAIKQYIIDKDPEKDTVWLSIKKIGQETSVNYDVESVSEPKVD